MEQVLLICVPLDAVEVVMHDLSRAFESVHMPWNHISFSIDRGNDIQELICEGMVIPEEGLDFAQRYIHQCGYMLEFVKPSFEESFGMGKAYMVIEGNAFDTITS